mmetsp:Transcript_31578/g.46599  ORF Transcript_31578/g.46599 Transcript_31578/m.46599 type:complete len:260 (+) Transcript_31578:172-951(+)
MILRVFLCSLILLFTFVTAISCFQTNHKHARSSRTRSDDRLTRSWVRSEAIRSSSTQLYFFDKVFEESGPLGKGITVGKVQVAVLSNDRSSNSIFSLLEKSARNAGSSNSQVLSQLANEVCLALLRKSEDWTAACSESKWFSQKDAGGAESLFNEWANREATKFEKEYIPGPDSEEKAGGPTTAVISLVIEIQGDSTKFEGAGFSLSGTKEVLSSIASDVMVERGDCLNAVEVFWTPSERDEVLTKQDIILDFPELIDL